MRLTFVYDVIAICDCCGESRPCQYLIMNGATVLFCEECHT